MGGAYTGGEKCRSDRSDKLEGTHHAGEQNVHKNNIEIILEE
jgi:hypothetical protein